MAHQTTTILVPFHPHLSPTAYTFIANKVGEGWGGLWGGGAEGGPSGVEQSQATNED